MNKTKSRGDEDTIAPLEVEFSLNLLVRIEHQLHMKWNLDT